MKLPLLEVPKREREELLPEGPVSGLRVSQGSMDRSSLGIPGSLEDQVGTIAIL